MTVTELPRHAAEPGQRSAPRWVPSRAGILNVWRYYDEVFEFHDGRLLLRGENGTGKSKALELLLPFLFDANLRANRLSTFGTGERTMHWNLMGEGASGTTRVGYVWLEFRLAGEPQRWFCCGARLQASTHTTTVHPDFFTTSLRIGMPDGLSLVTDAGQPLTRTVLEQQLGDDGVLHPSATDYRSAVRAALFPGMTEQRYDALITALLQLRMPKLSQRLDPSLLSTLLSRALPPLGQQEIADLAEGFERLDRQRERLATLDEEVLAARTLAGRQRSYAQRVLRAGAGTLISSTTELDNLTRTARQSAEEYELLAEQRQTAEEQIDTLTRDADDTEARITGLTESDSYQQGRELDRLRQQAAQARTQAATLRADADRTRHDAATDAAAQRDAERAAEANAESVRTQEADALRAATRAGLAGVHGEIAASLDTGSASPRLLLRAAIRGRHDQLDAVGEALAEHDRTVERRQNAETDLDEARTNLAMATDRHSDAVQRYDLELDRLAAQLQAWAASCRELTFPDVGALLAVIDSEPALLAVIDTAAAAVLHELTQGETIIEAARGAATTRRDELVADLERLGTEQELPPPVPACRTADRTTMSGAPLWRLVRFAGTTPEAAQAPIEAALQASGLLDAWVGRSGAIDGHDIFADPDAVGRAPDRSLAEVLVPESGSEVAPDTVLRLLTGIAYGDRLPAGHPAAVGADGCWRLGNLTGSWSKDHPAFIGALARQRAREQRMRELRTEIQETELVLAELDAQRSALGARRATVASERAARPDHRDLVESAHAVTRTESDVNAADGVVRQRITTLSQRERAVTVAFHALTRLAAEHGVPTDRPALTTLAQAVGTFSDQAEIWLDGHGLLITARRAADGSAAQARRSASLAEQRENEAAAADARNRSLSATLDAVEDAVGMDYRQVLAELDALRARLTDLRGERATATRSVTGLAERLGVLSAQRTSDARARDDATQARDCAARRFRHLATIGFAADSGLDDLAQFDHILSVSDGVRAALDAARMIAAAWSALAHAPNNLGDALHRLSESVHGCRTALSGRCDLDLETDEDVQVFTAMVDGVRIGAAELLRILRDEAEQSRRDITDRERELFDQTLTGDTRRHLAARIRQAGGLVDAMNARLERVRTASRVAVRLVWQVAQDLPPGTKAARDLLLKDPVRLTEADRESLHRFFRDRIEQAKADDTAASWEQQLAQVFDYTTWHQFVVKVDRANGAGWQLLTRKLHGALSGGEKAIALHLPLFAAIAAHYQAVPEAPRVILLDEVFVGVDSNNRGQVFELLSALDLDLMLTSDHEWCTYQELSGIAVHQLITGGDGDDAVTTARFVWNGHDL
ncbi:MAG TPA: TIGR02680 family protein, partial [Pseudonocardiaceae bacterium]